MRIAIGVVFLFIVMACSERGATESGSGASKPPTGQAAVTQTLAQRAECMNAEALRSFGERFADKEVWEQLPRMRDWSAIRAQVKRGGNIDALEIRDGQIVGSLGWHEGIWVCVERRNGELWASMPNSEAKAEPRWEGPFIAIDAKTDFHKAYFNRIFGNTCYQSEERESWCFEDGSISVGSTRYQARLHLGQSEMPDYGTPVDIEGREGFWIFVPDEGGWKVFKDDVVTNEERVEVDPKRDAPWRKLVPRQSN